jgi:hypothetical protein
MVEQPGWLPILDFVDFVELPDIPSADLLPEYRSEQSYALLNAEIAQLFEIEQESAFLRAQHGVKINSCSP